MCLLQTLELDDLEETVKLVLRSLPVSRIFTHFGDLQSFLPCLRRR